MSENGALTEHRYIQREREIEIGRRAGSQTRMGERQAVSEREHVRM